MEGFRAVGLSKTFIQGSSRIHALDSIDLGVEAGKIVALLGPSGAGKSTLIRALGLVSLADVGTIHFRGQLVASDGVAAGNVAELRRRYLGFVFQKANLVTFLTAHENVEIACEIGGTPNPRARADELLAYLDVAHRGQSYPEQLSGGEQQRVAIARALANHPRLILADEPTAALDKERGRAVMELFQQVAHEREAAVVVVTHDHRALDVFDEIYEMEDGRLSPLPPGNEPGHPVTPVVSR